MTVIKKFEHHKSYYLKVLIVDRLMQAHFDNRY